MNQTQILTEALKTQWLSNFEADQLVKSSQGQRRIREIRANPPLGCVFLERVMKEPCYHKQFKIEVK
jgi:hypothetical protein